MEKRMDKRGEKPEEVLYKCVKCGNGEFLVYFLMKKEKIVIVCESCGRKVDLKNLEDSLVFLMR